MHCHFHCILLEVARTSVCFNRLQNRNDVLRAFLLYISVINTGKKRGGKQSIGLCQA